MSPLRPPESLPREYVEVWRALKEADDRAGSRQSLAAQLGVSTHTIQRILVRGDVPSFPGESSIRVLHSWVRTLTRIATRLGHDPRRWIEGVGIAWTDEIARVSATSVATTRVRRDRLPGRSDRTGLTDRTDSDRSPVRVAIIPHAPFDGILPEIGTSFLEAASRRLLGSIDPAANPRIEILREAEAPGPGGFFSRFDLAVGILETTARRRDGLWFVPLPGWSTRLTAVCVARAQDAPSLARWSAWTATACAAPVIAAEGSAARSYLSGPSGLPASRLRVVPTADPRVLAHRLVDEARQTPAQAAVLLIDGAALAAEVIEQAHAIMEDDAETPGDLALLPMEDAATAPAFRVCLAGPEDSPVRPDLVRSALECEFLGAGAVATAHLYAAFAATFLRRIEEFPEATPAFRQAVCDGLVSLVRPPEYARTLIPVSWQPHLDAALRGEPEPARPAVSTHQCQSCSASLDDGIHGGVSDRYCRFCSDEEGQLRSREQVQGVLARWIRDWQDGLPEQEALRRAATLMQAMPAWSLN